MDDGDVHRRSAVRRWQGSGRVDEPMKHRLFNILSDDMDDYTIFRNLFSGTTILVE